MTDILKTRVFDPRLLQKQPVYDINVSPLQVNPTQNACQGSASSSAVNWNTPIGENFFLDRYILVEASPVFTWVVTLGPTNGNTIVGGQPIMCLGRDVAPAPFPFHQMVGQVQANVNNVALSLNLGATLPMLLRLVDLEDARKCRSCPTYLDRYAYNYDTTVTPNSSLAGFTSEVSTDQSPNGAYGSCWFTDSTGVPLNNGPLAVVTNVGGGSGYSAAYGQPCINAAGSTGISNYNIYFRVDSKEPLLLPPFIFREDEWNSATSLFGITNLNNLSMSFQPNGASRAVRLNSGFQSYTFQQVVSATGAPVATGAVASVSSQPVFATTLTAGQGPFMYSPNLHYTTYTAPISLPLAPKSVVPFMDIQPLPFQIGTAIPSTLGTTSSIVKSQVSGTPVSISSTNLSTIPDFIMIYTKPLTALTTTLFGAYPYPNGMLSGGYLTWSSDHNDWTLPIQGISLAFNGQQGLLSGASQYQLYKMSEANGLDMSWNEWSGEARAYFQRVGNSTAFSAMTLLTQGGTSGFTNYTAAAGSSSMSSMTNLVAWAYSSPASTAVAGAVFESVPVPTCATINALIAQLAGLFSGGTNSASVVPYVSTCGGPLLLRMGKDISLGTDGLAPGVVGNFPISLQVSLGNQFGVTVFANSLNLYLTTFNAGFIETIKGNSNKILSPLTPQDVIGAPVSSGNADVERLVGDGRRHKHISHAAGHRVKKHLAEYL